MPLAPVNPSPRACPFPQYPHLFVVCPPLSDVTRSFAEICASSLSLFAVYMPSYHMSPTRLSHCSFVATPLVSRACPFAVTLLLRRLPCVFTSFPPSSTRSPSCLPPSTRCSRLLLFAAAFGWSHTCPRPLVPVMLPDGGVRFSLCALLPWRIIVKIIIDHSSRFLAPAMLFYALFFMPVAPEHDGLNRAKAQSKGGKSCKNLSKPKKRAIFQYKPA